MPNQVEVPCRIKNRVLTPQGIADAHLVSFLQRLYSKTSIYLGYCKRATNTALILLKILYPLESIVYKDDLYTLMKIN
jgi:hypothetical protein